ncbi:hypothetical protein Hanom_Chr14g01285001 [Helianthus anomalus]
MNPDEKESKTYTITVKQGKNSSEKFHSFACQLHTLQIQKEEHVQNQKYFAYEASNALFLIKPRNIFQASYFHIKSVTNIFYTNISPPKQREKITIYLIRSSFNWSQQLIITKPYIIIVTVFS